MSEREGVSNGGGSAPSPTIVPLPSLGSDMDVGTVIEWLVGVGDRVERGDVVATVSTEKSDIDVESWESGWVTELIASLDEELTVGQPLLALAPVERSGSTTADHELLSPTPFPSHEPKVHVPPPDNEGVRSSVRASPRARRLAAAQGVELRDLVGSGPGGAITAEDVAPSDAEAKRTAPAPASNQERATVDPMRRAIADRMSLANREIPIYHLELDIDLSPAIEWLRARNADRPIRERIVPAALLARAVACAAAEVPQCNGSWINGGFRASATVDLGLVVSLRSGGLLTPTIHDAAHVGLDAMMSEMRGMVSGARSGQLRSRWTRDASITLTNLGDLGADRVAGIVFPPQVALVGFGRVSERPWVVDGSVLPRSVVTATLSADHRASDGADGSRFLAAVASALRDPDGFAD